MADDRTNITGVPEENGNAPQENWVHEIGAEEPGTEIPAGNEGTPEPETANDAENAEAKSPLEGIPWLRDMLAVPQRDDYRKADGENGSRVSEIVAQGRQIVRQVREGEQPLSEAVAAEDDGAVPEGTLEISQPSRDKRRGYAGRRSFREWRMTRKKVLRTPDYYDGPGKDEPFNINFDFQAEYNSPVRHHPIRRSTVKRTGWTGGLMYFAFVLCISVTIAALLWMAATDVLALGKEEGQVEVIVPEDYTVEEISQLLFSKGLVRYQKLFNLYGTYAHIEDTIDPGTYIVHTNFDYRALVYGLSDDGGEQIIEEVTIPEGSNMDQIMDILEEHGICSRTSFLDAAANTEFDYDWLTEGTGDPYRLEGFLFPDTYEFYVNDDADRVIEKFLDDFDYRFDEELRLRAEEMGYSVREILSVAAIIEEEAGSNDERADIASVIYNRISEESIGLLQMDSTVFYAASREGVEFDTGLDSPYNTYVYAGLPGPITNPGLASIRAALYPNETDYLYFAINTEGISVFFEDYESFDAFTNSEEYGG